MRLLSRERLVKTGPVDYADWNYRSVLGYIQQWRFSLALSLLPARSQRLLEVGFGSGILMPALNDVTLYGIDVHCNIAKVRSVLESEAVNAVLLQTEAEMMPFEDNCFDGVLAVILEFVHDLGGVCAHIHRVLKKTGVFVVVTPGDSPLIDAGLKLLTGQAPA